MSKHLVTGSSGFLGSAIVKKLHQLGHQVVTLDIIEDKEISKISEFFKVDISDDQVDFKKILKNVKYIHHNAALVPLTKAGSNFYKANVLGTKNIIEHSIRENVEHFSHMSSSAIFGKPKQNENVNYYKYNPTGLYGKSKYLAEIEVNNNCDISTFFERYGETLFREKESEILGALADINNHVISTGGGIILKEENINLLKEIGLIVFLDIGLKAQIKRVKYRKHRPLLKNDDLYIQLKKLKKNRDPIYNSISDYIIDVSNKDKDTVVEEIYNKLT